MIILKNARIAFFFLFLLVISGPSYSVQRDNLLVNSSSLLAVAEKIAGAMADVYFKKITEVFFEKNIWPSNLKVGESFVDIEYTFDKELMKHLEHVLKRYGSDYTSIVVIDNESGAVLAAIGRERRTSKISYVMPFSSTHPSASLIKIITTAELLQNSEVEASTRFAFRGRGTTLYKRQLSDRVGKRPRVQTLKQAFASSNNVVFGKAAMNYSSAWGIYNMATQFGFNQDLMADISIPQSTFEMPSDDFDVAAFASGFNSENMMSPVHAATLSMIIANDGIIKYPYVIQSITKAGTKLSLWDARTQERLVLETDTAKTLKNMMSQTVLAGTARKSFSRMNSFFKQHLLIGGKTGSITGGKPFGKRDWFTAFAVPKDKELGHGISISVMNVNVGKWYAKSSYITREIIEFYYKKIFLLKDKLSSSNAEKKQNQKG